MKIEKPGWFFIGFITGAIFIAIGLIITTGAGGYDKTIIILGAYALAIIFYLFMFKEKIK